MTCFSILQERGTTTEPPPRATYSSNVTQWEIYDAYQEDFEKQVSSLNAMSDFLYQFGDLSIVTTTTFV